jgi:hypothetical protein
MSVFFLALFLPPQFATLPAGFDTGVLMPLLIVIPLAAGAVWLLRHQSARVAPRRES